ncbi:MAG TPA: hypothetical protein VHN77_03355, partial [Phycisphaerales bacterium]|nr:hypothetical protein [Phycisphaerales bacterium]
MAFIRDILGAVKRSIVPHALPRKRFVARDAAALWISPTAGNEVLEIVADGKAMAAEGLHRLMNCNSLAIFHVHNVDER